jgi:8-oxo-dGTP pyrophosphatase MutT (NUDIX family)
MAYNSITGCGALIYCRSTHRYLFLLRDTRTHRNHWGLVGGKVEAGETISAALVRETKEEINVDISQHKIRPLETFTSEDTNFSYHTFIVVVEEEFVPDLNHEHVGYCWVPLQRYPKPLHPGVWRTFKFDSVIEKIKTVEKLTV